MEATYSFVVPRACGNAAQRLRRSAVIPESLKYQLLRALAAPREAAFELSSVLSNASSSCITFFAQQAQTSLVVQ